MSLLTVSACVAESQLVKCSEVSIMTREVQKKYSGPEIIPADLFFPTVGCEASKQVTSTASHKKHLNL